MNLSRTKKSLLALLLCYLIWGLQPIYWNLLGSFNSMFILCVRIVMSMIFTWLYLICSGRLRELLAAFRNKKLMKFLVPASVFICADWGLVQLGSHERTRAGHGARILHEPNGHLHHRTRALP